MTVAKWRKLMNGEIIPVVLLGSLFFVLPLVLYVECEINCDVFGDEHDGHAHLTFEEFYAYYLISPNKWDIDLDSLYYNRGEDFIRKKVTFLRVRDVIRYRRFAKKRRDQRLCEFSDISKLAIIKGMSEDAGKLQESALKDIERATKRYIEIVRRCEEAGQR